MKIRVSERKNISELLFSLYYDEAKVIDNLPADEFMAEVINLDFPEVIEAIECQDIPISHSHDQEKQIWKQLTNAFQTAKENSVFSMLKEASY